MIDTDLIILNEILFHAEYMDDHDTSKVTDIQIDSECIAYLRFEDDKIVRYQLTPGAFYRTPAAGSDQEFMLEVAAHLERVQAMFPDYSQEKIRERTNSTLKMVQLVGLAASVGGRGFGDAWDFIMGEQNA